MQPIKLNRGDVVAALTLLDPEGANVPAGTLGVVFEEAGAYSHDSAPMVRWFNGAACEVYDGDIARADGRRAEPLPLTSFKMECPECRHVSTVNCENKIELKPLKFLDRASLEMMSAEEIAEFFETELPAEITASRRPTEMVEGYTEKTRVDR
jgi:hypothetical protein